MNDRYEIRAKIGVGGMGAVYRAYDRQLRREVALKRLLPQDQKEEEARKTAEYLIQEAGLLSKLQHPNIVTVYDCGIDADGGFVVMELIKGETLNDTIKRGALPLKDFNSVVEQALEGLIAAQEIGMLHRDLKPTNVMICWFPSGSFQLKILDFGLAKVTDQPALQTLDHGNSILGSIYFMSPEQLEREPLDARTDIYSLGCLLYYCLAGRFPFRGKGAPEVMVAHLEHDVTNVQKTRPDIPGPVCDWVMRLMARDRENRPTDAREALSEYEAILAALPKKAPGTTTDPVPLPGSSPARRRLITGPIATRSPSAGSAAAIDTGNQRVQTAAVLRPLHRANRKRAWLWTLSATAAIAATIGAYLAWVPNGDSTTPSDTSPATEHSAPPESPQDAFKLPQENPDADLAVTLVPFGFSWRYPNPGEPPGEGWEGPDFDDQAWKSGASPIGYGESDLRTTIDVPVVEGNRPMTLYYRARIALASAPPEDSFADLQVIADDGAVVYVNGTEVARIGLPAGTLHHETSTVRRLEETSEKWLTRARFPASLLTAGSNVLAVRVHQIKPTSTDSWFDFKLGLCRLGIPPSPNASLAPANGFREIAPTAETAPQEWQFSMTPLEADWDRAALPDGSASLGRGIPATPDFPTQAPRIPWESENLWMTRAFHLSESDIRKPEHIAFKVLHTGAVTIFLNGRFAAECLGTNNGYILLPLDARARAALTSGENRLSVHARGGSPRQAVDVGLVRLD